MLTNRPLDWHRPPKISAYSSDARVIFSSRRWRLTEHALFASRFASTPIETRFGQITAASRSFPRSIQHVVRDSFFYT